MHTKIRNKGTSNIKSRTIIHQNSKSLFPMRFASSLVTPNPKEAVVCTIIWSRA